MFSLHYLPHRPEPPNRLPAALHAPSAGGGTDATGDPPAVPVETIAEPRQIAHILRTVADARRPVMLSSQQLPRGIQTRLLAASTETGTLLIRQVVDEEAHRILLADRRINLLSEHLGSPMLCSVPITDTARHGGSLCYVTPMPDWVLFCQMRATLRVAVPASLEFTLGHDAARRERVQAGIIDVSEGGIGLVIPHLPLRRIGVGEQWARAMIRGTGMHVGPVDLCLRHYRTESGRQHFGAMFVRPAGSIRQHLRRLVLLLQSRAARGTES